jgi:hypothetical protein
MAFIAHTYLHSELKMMTRFIVSSLFCAAALSSPVAFAEDGHNLSTIKGDLNINLMAYDHAMAGSIKDFVIWGSVNESEGKSELIMRRDGQDVKAIFKQVDKTFGGTVEHRTDYGPRSTSVQFAGLDRQKNEYSFQVNGEVIKARVVSEDFQNNHFIKPTYTIVNKDGSQTSFKFEGQACYKYSMHILTMMIAATTH